MATTLCVLARSAVADDRRAPSLVHVYVAGPPEAVLRTRATVRELLARIQVDAVVEPASDEAVLAEPAPDGVARAFLDFRSLAGTRVALAPSGPDHDIVRRTLPASSLEVSVEEAAHIVYAAVEASRDASTRPAAAGSGASESPATGEAPPATSAPPPGASSDATGTGAGSVSPSPPPKTTSLAPAAQVVPAPQQNAESRAGANGEDHGPPKTAHAGSSALVFDAAVSVFGGMSSYGGDAVLPGVGGALDVRFGSASLRPGAMLSAGVFFPSSVSSGDVGGSLRAESLRLLGLVEWTPSPRFGFALAAGGGADHVTFDPGASSAVVVSEGAASRYDPALQGLVSARLRFSSAFGVFALAAADVDLTPHRYVTETLGDATPFFALPRVRPTALAGVTYVFHEGHRPAEPSR
ncbi:MAG TPA: hypothetical protein VHC69_01725 [Polyangiaceae bacterium]|nr:hypothetical protein [Polyangiaceae bacterium]